jgi:hypothetical protein
MKYNSFRHVSKPLRKDYKLEETRGWLYLRLYRTVDEVPVPKLL